MNHYHGMTAGIDAFPIGTADAVVGDHVRWTEPVFAGGGKEPVGERTIEAVIVEDRYGAELPPGALTLLVTATDDGIGVPPVGTMMRVRDLSLYRHGCRRREWADESRRLAVRLGIRRRREASRGAARPNLRLVHGRGADAHHG